MTKTINPDSTDLFETMSRAWSVNMEGVCFCFAAAQLRYSILEARMLAILNPFLAASCKMAALLLQQKCITCVVGPCIRISLVSIVFVSLNLLRGLLRRRKRSKFLALVHIQNYLGWLWLSPSFSHPTSCSFP